MMLDGRKIQKSEGRANLEILAVKEMCGKLPIKTGLIYVNPEVQELCMMDVDEKRIGMVVDEISAVVERVLKNDFEVDYYKGDRLVACLNIINQIKPNVPCDFIAML